MDYEVKNIYGKIKNVRAAVSVPGSKSITARALLIAALARGVSTLYNAQFSDDCATFANCLKSLGIGIEADGTTVKVFGCGGKLPIKSATINVGSAGTAARFLTALLAFTDGEFTIDSSEQMKRRPQAPLIKALRSAGTDIEGETFPLKVRGSSSPKNGIEVDITESSQFLSALLISSVCLEKPVPVSVVGEHGLGYVDMTADMMWSFGVNVEKNGNTYIARGSYSAKKYEIEPDLSAASYFFAMNRSCTTALSAPSFPRIFLQFFCSLSYFSLFVCSPLCLTVFLLNPAVLTALKNPSDHRHSLKPPQPQLLLPLLSS